MTVDELVNRYEEMKRIRLLEERVNEEFKKQEMRTPLHSCIGQEAIAVGICTNLGTEDTIYSNHRGHGHYISKGGGMEALIAELYNRKTGCSKGYGGSMHIIDRKHGVGLTSSIVAGTVPIATGNALAFTLKNENNVAVAFFGDGASEEGCVYESICFAAVKKLPIVYVCENNFYAMYTAMEKREPVQHIVDKFSGILPSYIVDGNDIEAVEEIAKKAIAHARDRKGPVFLECETYRFVNHYESASVQDFWYREKAEWEKWIEKCPIKRAEEKIVKLDKRKAEQLKKIDEKLMEEIERAFEFALNSEYPDPQDVLVGMWG